MSGAGKYYIVSEEHRKSKSGGAKAAWADSERNGVAIDMENKLRLPREGGREDGNTFFKLKKHTNQ